MVKVVLILMLVVAVIKAHNHNVVNSWVIIKQSIVGII